MVEKKTWAMLLMCVGLPLLACLGALLLKRLIGCPCQFCENNRMTSWDELDLRQQDVLLRYFKSCEGREPDTSAVFVCKKCGTVFDDFSGEKRSMERDMGSGCTTWCKVCNGIVVYCDLDNDNIVCGKCGTPYAWRVYKDSGYRLLMPPEDANILQKCRGMIIADI